MTPLIHPSLIGLKRSEEKRVMYYYLKFLRPFDEDILIAELSEFNILGTVSDDESLIVYFSDKPADNIADFFRRKYSLEEGYVNETIDDWLAKFRETFKAFRVSDNLVISPVWLRQNGCDNCIYIYPGHAFGTGLHFTTKSSLILMEKSNIADKRVLDFGCGSAILSIYAEKLGANSVLAVDNEFEAIKEAQRHLNINGSKKVSLVCSDIYGIVDKFDLVVSNIMYQILEERLKEIRERIKRGGEFIFAGILKKYKDEFLLKLKEIGFEIKVLVEDNEWVSGLSILEY